ESLDRDSVVATDGPEAHDALAVFVAADRGLVGQVLRPVTAGEGGTDTVGRIRVSHSDQALPAQTTDDRAVDVHEDPSDAVLHGKRAVIGAAPLDGVADSRYGQGDGKDGAG